MIQTTLRFETRSGTRKSSENVGILANSATHKSGFETKPRQFLRSVRPIMLVVLSSLSVCSVVSAMAPELRAINPRGCQRGTEAVLIFRGNRLLDIEEIFFHYPGISVVKFEPIDDKQVKVTVKVEETCRLGEHAVRLRTKTGISELRTFFVGPYESLAEKEPNNDFSAPQPVSMNVTIEGVIQSEDVDHFLVEAKKGDRITAEVEGIRLGATLFDPYVAILDLTRSELAVSDDHPLFYLDPSASLVAPEDGKYVIQIRDTSYGGNSASSYRLHVGNFPRPTAVYPAGGRLGQEIAVRFLGDVKGEIADRVQLPYEDQGRFFGLECRQSGLVAPSTNAFRLCDFDNVLESEPNDDPSQATPMEQSLPLAFNGIISKTGDHDHFRFTAKKGQQYDVQVHARAIRSPLDPVLDIYDSKGKRLSGNDDSQGPDSFVRFKVPADGEYVLRIRDHLENGGSDYVYRVEMTPTKPELTLTIPQLRRYSQERQQIVVPRGNRYLAIVSVQRSNFGGELLVSGQDLPEGVTIETDKVAANVSSFPVVFRADPDAPLSGGFGNLLCRTVDEQNSVSSRFVLDAQLVRGRPGQSIYWHHYTDNLAVAVGEEFPFEIDLVEPKVPLVRNGQMSLKVIAKRKEGFDAPITVTFPYRPSGLGARSSVKISKGKSECAYLINANSKAEARSWKVAVLASAEVDGGLAWVSSDLVELAISPPFVESKIPMTAIEQGTLAEVVCKIDQKIPFEGKAKLELLGLPNKCTTQEMQITKETKEVVFPVSTEPDSPVGKHKTLFCRLTIIEEGEPIVHSLSRGSILRIDRPRQPPKDQPQAPPKAVAKSSAPSKIPAKRLSRLEQLRLEATQRAKATQEITPVNE